MRQLVILVAAAALVACGTDEPTEPSDVADTAAESKASLKGGIEWFAGSVDEAGVHRTIKIVRPRLPRWRHRECAGLR
jgi:hypothetical protein